MHITRDNKMVVAVLTSSGGKLIVRDENSHVTYKNSYIYSENWVIERYQGYTKANLMMSHEIYGTVNFLKMKSALDTRSILKRKNSPAVFKFRSKGINISPLVAPLQECEKEILIIHKGSTSCKDVFHLQKHQCRYQKLYHTEKLNTSSSLKCRLPTCRMYK